MEFINSIRTYLATKITEPESQRRMVLVIVCIALLLDNMLYMVIVPIIPNYLTAINAFNHSRRTWRNGSIVIEFPVQRSHGPEVGFLFASKAIVQLLINPLSGTVIDRIGYDKPMMFGLGVIFVSTTVFAFGTSYSIMFLARSLQGVGSAFADTSGLAMIADRFTEENERTTALGIALAFISFGSLVAPPFGGILYALAGKVLPFICLALIALVDGFLLLIVMKPTRVERRVMKAEGNLPQGAPMTVLLKDRHIAICAGALAMSNVSLAFLEPTIATWMEQTMKGVLPWQLGLVWLPAFFPHVAGVYTTVKLASKYPDYQWLMVAIGLALEGCSCLFIPFCTNFILLMIPICVICYGIALVDTAVLPTLGYVVDTRYVSIYGSVYAIADISYSLAYAFGPILAGGLVVSIGFTGLNIAIFLSNIAYVPLTYLLKDVYKYKNLDKLKEEDGDEETHLKEGPIRKYMTNGGQGEGTKPQLHDVDSAVIPTTHPIEIQPAALNRGAPPPRSGFHDFNADRIKSDGYGY